MGTTCIACSFLLLAGAKRTALQVGWSQEARDRAENKTEHNSLNFGARSPKFCMQVDLDRPQPFPDTKSTKVQKVQKYKSTKIQKYKVQNKKVQKYKKCK